MFAAILLIAALAYTQAHAELPPLQHQGSTDYVSGGVGLDESTAFKAAMAQFPLALTFASNRDGHSDYVADVQVVVRDSQNNNILNATSEGPYFLARLPAGKYDVFATYKGQTQSRKADIGSTGTVRLIFEWK
ncbi:MAG: carboxypeptidase regulatory-like domain-containing protein [Candidimonas sp.]|nr:MAG: carboxypeptidase regulatory-like domain-containing protein [Candidimonas sp.]TAM21029.1 MAG: carboxypeptidase regulatory-like domain-containing protein [Candidimonas sp.]TAM80318.1 MAG: carboxypeptidase regulatory-like domain-containing protein [Candidimonas sp.]